MYNPVALSFSSHSPFLLENEASYQRWRQWKLEDYPVTTEELIVEVADPRRLSAIEIAEMLRVCRKTNMVIYASPAVKQRDKAIPRQVGEQFGLQRLDSNSLADDDGITSLQVAPGKSTRGYIPYSNQRLLWHSDGYYNPPERPVRAFILHCVTPAAQGGDNALLDHDMVYMSLRDANPDFIEALMAADAMIIPANTEPGAEVRAAQAGPVFSLAPGTGNLHMRYTARTRSIEWKQDKITQQALAFLQDLLAGNTPRIFRHRLAAGQGLLCNNVLHNRTGFVDDVDTGQVRLIYRARYFDHIVGTQLNAIFDPKPTIGHNHASS